MDSPHVAGIAVIDFRRQSMMLEWQPDTGGWTACEEPPSRVHGIALIRSSLPNVCVFGQDGQLKLQLGSEQCTLSDGSAQLRFARDVLSLGLRRRFTVLSAAGAVLMIHRYWNGQGDEFFRWLARRASDAQWRRASGRLWSDGVEAAVLRAG